MTAHHWEHWRVKKSVHTFSYIMETDLGRMNERRKTKTPTTPAAAATTTIIVRTHDNIHTEIIITSFFCQAQRRRQNQKEPFIRPSAESVSQLVNSDQVLCTQISLSNNQDFFANRRRLHFLTSFDLSHTEPSLNIEHTNVTVTINSTFLKRFFFFFK